MPDDYVLETSNLVKGFVAVDDVNLKVRRGHIHARIGPNGAGKTTVFTDRVSDPDAAPPGRGEHHAEAARTDPQGGSGC